jgi:DNA-binding GntR family transcriptional regulator
MTNAVHSGRTLSRTHTTVDFAHSMLLAAIVKGDLSGGQELDDSSWARDLSLSRTPVREAFKRLEGQGIVDFTTGGHSRLVTFTSEQARQEANHWATAHQSLVASQCLLSDEPLITRLQATRDLCQDNSEADHHALAFDFFAQLHRASQCFGLRLSASTAAYRLRLARQSLPDHRDVDLRLQDDVIAALRRGEPSSLVSAFACWTQTFTRI